MERRRSRGCAVITADDEISARTRRARSARKGCCARPRTRSRSRNTTQGCGARRRRWRSTGEDGEIRGDLAGAQGGGAGEEESKRFCDKGLRLALDSEAAAVAEGKGGAEGMSAQIAYPDRCSPRGKGDVRHAQRAWNSSGMGVGDGDGDQGVQGDAGIWP